MGNRNDFNPEVPDDAAVGPCIGLLELGSIARGVEVADAILWEAAVELLFSTPVQPGKYVMLFTGSVQSVQSSAQRGAELAGCDLVDQLVIPQLHEQVLPILKRVGGKINGQIDAVGVLETTTVASTLLAADLSLKTASVDLIEIRLAMHLGGKGFFLLAGETGDVEAACAAAADLARARRSLVREVVIPRASAELVEHLF